MTNTNKSAASRSVNAAISMLTLLMFLNATAGLADERVKLKPGTNELPVMELPNGGGLDIYGVEWELRGNGVSFVNARGYAPCVPGGPTISFDPRFGHYTRIALPEWQPFRVEFMGKKDWKSIKVILGLDKNGEAEVRNIRIVRGGFKPDAIAGSAPYVDWINSLVPDMGYAIKMPTPQPSEKNRDMQLALVKPYMEVPLKKLLSLVPEYSFHWQKDRYYQFSWDISNPDVILDKNGIPFDYKKIFPENGFVEVTGTGGKAYRMAYHESPEADSRNRLYDGKRVYLGRFMETARFMKLAEVALAMAELYRLNGKEEYALRATALFTALWKNADNWPAFGRGEDYNIKPARFHAPDSYELWFAFILGAGDWYIPATGSLRLPARNFAMLKNAPASAWEEAGRLNGIDKPQITMAAKILDLAKQSLLRDAFQRRRPWILYHNTIGGQLQTFIEIAMAVGCPELVHYAFNKYSSASANVLMADGMFPESTSYFIELFEGGFSSFRAKLKNYSDPEGFRDSQGRRFDRLDPEKVSPPVVNRAYKLLARLVFPDGSPYVINDTFAASAPFTKFSYRPDLRRYARDRNDSLLIPDFGYSSQGWGHKSDQVEVHMNYSASGNHAHNDLLNLTLWAYGDEIVSDIGYTRFNNYPGDTLSHNLVMVDSEIQRGRHRGDLSIWSDLSPDAVKFQQAGQNPAGPAYPQTSRYRRTLVSLPLTFGKTAVVDIFEVKGGKRHDWLAQGCADYPQNISSSLKKGTGVDNLSDDGKRVDASQPLTGRGGKSPHYGAIRNLTRYDDGGEYWNVTVTPGKLSPDIPGIAPRAAAALPHAGFRLHWTGMRDTQVYIGEAPRHRFYMEKDNAATQRQCWTTNLMPKIVVRREGEVLDSRFVALWEPFPEKPWIERVESFADIPACYGNAIRLSAADCEAAILFRTPDSTAKIRAGKFKSNADIAVWRRVGTSTHLDQAGAGIFQAGDITLNVSAWPCLRALRSGKENNEDYLIVSGDLDAYPADPGQQPHAGRWVIFRQQGQGVWWLPVKRIDKEGSDRARIVFSREIGFGFDGENKLLTGKFFDYKSSFGQAEVILPVNTSVTIAKDHIECHISSSIQLTLPDNLRPEPTEGVTLRKTEPGFTLDIPPHVSVNGKIKIRLVP